jgi:hypothetical protein
VRVSRASSRGQILRDAMKDHWSQANVDDRDVAYTLQDKPYSEWSTQERDAALRVGIRISQIGFLLRNFYADRRSFLDLWAPWCVRPFVILSPIIADMRVSQDTPDQWIYLSGSRARRLSTRPKGLGGRSAHGLAETEDEKSSRPKPYRAANIIRLIPS